MHYLSTNVQPLPYRRVMRPGPLVRLLVATALLGSALACNTANLSATPQVPSLPRAQDPTPVRLPLALTSEQLGNLAEFQPFSGWPVQVRQVSMQEVVAENVFWVGDSPERRILIVAVDGEAATTATASGDQPLTAFGNLRNPQAADTVIPTNLDPALQELVRQQAVYVEVERVEVGA